MEYASCFAELSRFALKYVATDHMRMLKFEKGLVPLYLESVGGQPVQSSQELYKHATKIERVKNKLRMTN